MNKAILIGRLANDPEYRQTSNGTSVCKFRLAVNRRHTNADGQRQADFLEIITWRGLADNVHRYLSKGKQAGVVGEIQTRSYEAQDGTKRYVTEIVADDVEFLTPKSTGEGNGSATGGSEGGFTENDDDELPF